MLWLRSVRIGVGRKNLHALQYGTGFRSNENVTLSALRARPLGWRSDSGASGNAVCAVRPGVRGTVVEAGGDRRAQVTLARDVGAEESVSKRIEGVLIDKIRVLFEVWWAGNCRNLMLLSRQIGAEGYLRIAETNARGLCGAS